MTFSPAQSGRFDGSSQQLLAQVSSHEDDWTVRGDVRTLQSGLLTLFTLPFVWFIAHVDRFEREPAKLAVLGFLWGGLAATWVIGLVLLFLPARNHVRSAYDGLLLGALHRPRLRHRRHRPHRARRFGVAAGLLVVAMIIHGSLDAVAAVSEAVIPFTVIAGTLGIVLVWRFADRRQRTWIATLLAPDAEAGTISAPELAARIAATDDLEGPDAQAARAELTRIRTLAPPENAPS